MKKTVVFLSILMMAICLSACGSKKEKFGILTWNENAGSEVIEACGLNPDDYELTCKTLPEINMPGPENSDNKSLSREASIIESAFEFVTHDYSVVAFQMNEYWNSAAHKFMEENPDITVYILDETGTYVLDSQNAVSENAKNEEKTGSNDNESASGRYAESNIKADDEGHEWNWRLLETEKIYDDGFYLLRGDSIYSLNKMNVSENKISGKGYLYDRIRRTNKNTKDDIILALSYVPTPVIKSGDTVVGYSESSVPTLVLQKVNFLGWTIGAYTTIEDDHTGPAIYYDDEGNRCIDGGDTVVTNYTVRDQDGNAVDDPYNLETYAPYTAEWYLGTKALGGVFDARCRAFAIDGEASEYKVEGSLNGKDYAEYDLSGVPAGTYLVIENSKGFGAGGLITIE